MKVNVRHPYIASKRGVCGGSPIIKGTRIPVWAIVGYYKDLQYSVEEIAAQLRITPAQIHDALSFYYDHQEEIDRELELNRDEERWKSRVLPHGS